MARLRHHLLPQRSLARRKTQRQMRPETSRKRLWRTRKSRGPLLQTVAETVLVHARRHNIFTMVMTMIIVTIIFIVTTALQKVLSHLPFLLSSSYSLTSILIMAKEETLSRRGNLHVSSGPDSVASQKWAAWSLP